MPEDSLLVFPEKLEELSLLGFEIELLPEVEPEKVPELLFEEVPELAPEEELPETDPDDVLIVSVTPQTEHVFLLSVVTHLWSAFSPSVLLHTVQVLACLQVAFCQLCPKGSPLVLPQVLQVAAASQVASVIS